MDNLCASKCGIGLDQAHTHILHQSAPVYVIPSFLVLRILCNNIVREYMAVCDEIYLFCVDPCECVYHYFFQVRDNETSVLSCVPPCSHLRTHPMYPGLPLPCD
jgi:hypothetical protein